MNITEISNGKTRVLMFGLSPEVSKLTFHILNYHGKIYDYYSNNLQNIDGNDFFILETHSESDIQNFPPTIAFFGIKHQLENYHPILVQSIYAFISGIFLGNVKRKTDSLETVIFCHSFFNLIGFPYLGYIYYYPIELVVKKFLHTENFIVMAIALSILPIIGFIWSWKKLGRDLYKL